jgi:hypothetical protein
MRADELSKPKRGTYGEHMHFAAWSMLTNEKGPAIYTLAPKAG